MLVDTHCHLDFSRFNQDRPQVIKRANKASVKKIIIPGVDIPSCQAAVKLAEQNNGIYAAVGIHPNSASNWKDRTLKQLLELADSPKVVAIGEIGLDYYRDRTPKAKQQQAFRAQLSLAATLQLPIIIHSRDAYSDILKILKDWHTQLVKSGSPLASNPGVFHSFSAGLSEAEQAIQMNFLLGISGPVTFNNAKNLQHTVSKLALNNLIVETNAPYLTPHPFRGKRNEPEKVKLVAKKIAELHKTTLDQVAKTTTENANKLFKLESA